MWTFKRKAANESLIFNPHMGLFFSRVKGKGVNPCNEAREPISICPDQRDPGRAQ